MHGCPSVLSAHLSARLGQLPSHGTSYHPLVDVHAHRLQADRPIHVQPPRELRPVPRRRALLVPPRLARRPHRGKRPAPAALVRAELASRAQWRHRHRRVRPPEWELVAPALARLARPCRVCGASARIRWGSAEGRVVAVAGEPTRGRVEVVVRWAACCPEGGGYGRGAGYEGESEDKERERAHG